jgi:hypothetical protein
MSVGQQPVRNEAAIELCSLRRFRSSAAVVSTRPSRIVPAGLVVPFASTWRNGTRDTFDAELAVGGNWPTDTAQRGPEG